MRTFGGNKTIFQQEFKTKMFCMIKVLLLKTARPQHIDLYIVEFSGTWAY